MRTVFTTSIHNETCLFVSGFSNTLSTGMFDHLFSSWALCQKWRLHDKKTRHAWQIHIKVAYLRYLNAQSNHRLHWKHTMCELFYIGIYFSICSSSVCSYACDILVPFQYTLRCRIEEHVKSGSRKIGIFVSYQLLITSRSLLVLSDRQIAGYCVYRQKEADGAAYGIYPRKITRSDTYSMMEISTVYHEIKFYVWINGKCVEN